MLSRRNESRFICLKAGTQPASTSRRESAAGRRNFGDHYMLAAVLLGLAVLPRSPCLQLYKDAPLAEAQVSIDTSVDPSWAWPSHKV